MVSALDEIPDGFIIQDDLRVGRGDFGGEKTCDIFAIKKCLFLSIREEEGKESMCWESGSSPVSGCLDSSSQSSCIEVDLCCFNMAHILLRRSNMVE